MGDSFPSNGKCRLLVDIQHETEENTFKAAKVGPANDRQSCSSVMKSTVVGGGGEKGGDPHLITTWPSFGLPRPYRLGRDGQKQGQVGAIGEPVILPNFFLDFKKSLPQCFGVPAPGLL